MSSLPTQAPVKVPTASPSVAPKPVVMPATQDATIRGGGFRDTRFGLEPFIANVGDANRFALVEFDASGLLPGVEYSFSLRFYVSFVGADESRVVTVNRLDSAVEWNEATVTWSSFGDPDLVEVGWFTIFDTDEDTQVEIALGSLPTLDDGKITLVFSIPEKASGPEKFDFRSANFEGDESSFPTLTATPILS